MAAEWQEFRVFTSDRLSLLKRLFPRFQSELGGEIQRFFYVLYDEGGSHIRLRIETAEAISTAHVRGVIGSWLGRHEHVEYCPESHRYGGEAGMQYAHDSFDASSQFFLAYLSSGVAYNRRRALSLAAITQLAIMHAASLSTIQLVEFSKVLRDLWGYTITEVTGRRVEMPNKSCFSSDLLDKIARAWKAYSTRNWEINELCSFRLAHEQVFRNFSKLLKTSPELTVSGNLHMVLAQKPSCSEADPRLLTILANIIHMHNNRMGLSNGQEVMVSQLLVSALEG